MAHSTIRFEQRWPFRWERSLLRRLVQEHLGYRSVRAENKRLKPTAVLIEVNHAPIEQEEEKNEQPDRDGPEACLRLSEFASGRCGSCGVHWILANGAKRMECAQLAAALASSPSGRRNRDRRTRVTVQKR